MSVPPEAGDKTKDRARADVHRQECPWHHRQECLCHQDSHSDGGFDMADPFLRFSDRITCLPVIHGSGDFALEARRLMLDEKFDCVAVPLPPSFKRDVEAAVKLLPAVTM